MAYIKLDDRIINNFKSDDLEAMLNSIIDAELSKDVSQVNTELVNECVNALIGMEQENDDKFNALIPLLPPDEFLKKVQPKGFSWKKANVFVRAGVIAAVVAGSTLTVNAAVEGITGVNLIQTAGEAVRDKLENWGIVKKQSIDVFYDDEDDDTVETTAPSTTEPTTVEETTEPTATAPAQTTTKKPNIDIFVDDDDETTTKKANIDIFIDDEDDESTTVQNDTTAKPEETQPTTRPATTNKPVVPTTEKPVVNPTPDDKVVFTGLSAEFDNFKTDYIYGEELSYEGLILKANYSNGLYEAVSLDECSYTKNLDMNVTADYELRIIYKNSVVTINITVRPDEDTRASQICQNDLYDYLLTDRGAYITAYYGNETDIILSEVDGNRVIAVGSDVFAGSDIKFISADNIEKVFPNAFKDCGSLVECYTPRAIYIGNNAFENCTNLKEAEFSDSLSYIGDSAYKNTGIKEITVPQGITTIPNSLCENCEALEKVSFAGRVTEIGNLAFSGCTSLLTVNGTADITNVGDWAFADDTMVNFDCQLDKLETAGKYAFSKCNSLDVGTLTSIKSFESGAFQYCYLLTSITVPDSMTEIPYAAFMGTRITAIALHDNITTIGDYAFMSTMLTEINIPASVEKIGNRALYTTRLRKAYFYNPNVEIEDDAFYAGSRLTFYVFADSTAMKYADDNGISYEIID